MATSDPEAHARITVFIEEYFTDHSFLQSLGTPGFHNAVVADVVRLDQWLRAGYDVWRIKIMGFDTTLGRLRHFLNHRFVYAFDDTNETIWVLGIFHRNHFNYDPNEPNGKRVAAAYESLKLPKMPIVTMH